MQKQRSLDAHFRITPAPTFDARRSLLSAFAPFAAISDHKSQAHKTLCTEVGYRQPSLSSIMDYSASIHDADHPAEASPWGSSPSSSPRHNRTTFGATTSDQPTLPFQYPPHGAHDGLQDAGGFGPIDGGFQQSDTTNTTSTVESLPGDPRSDDTVPSQQDSLESQGFAAEGQSPLPPAPQQLGHPPQSFAQHQAPAQQQHQHQHPVSGQQQQARRPPPQYKLQAKITGLERTGRKDPILRFDVHV